MQTQERTSMPTIVDQNGKAYRRSLATMTHMELSEIFARQAREVGSGGCAFKTVWVYSIISTIAMQLQSVPSGWWSPASNAKGLSFSSDNWVPNFESDLNRLMDQPNEWQDKERFIEQMVTWLLGGGNVWVYKVYENYDANRLPDSLLLFSIRDIRPIRRESNQPPQGWEFTNMMDPKSNKPLRVPLDRMIHIMMPNDYDQFMGLPPWAAVEKQLAADGSRVSYDKYFFDNNATPDAVLTHKPGPINEDNARLVKQAWFDNYGGADNAGNLAVIGGDWELKVLGVSHSQSQFLENRNFTRAEIASVYHFPVQLLNAMEKGQLGKEQLSVARTLLWENAIFPVGRKIENGLNKLSKNEKRKVTKYFFDYDGHPVMVDYMAKKAETARLMLETGIPINEALARLDMGFKDIEGGDEALVSTRLQLLKEATTPKWEEKALELEKLKEKGLNEETPQKPETKPKREEKMIDASKIKYTQRLNSINHVVDVSQQKIKRILYDIKNDCFRNLENDSPFNLKAYKARWIKQMREFAILSAYVGYMSGKNRQVTLTKESVKIFVDNLRSNPNISTSPEILSDLDAQVLNSFRIISDLWYNLRKLGKENRETRTNEILSDIMQKARDIALRNSLWARNAGEYHSMNGNVRTLKRHKGCPHTGRYPGDPNTPLDRILNCLCITASEEKHA